MQFSAHWSLHRCWFVLVLSSFLSLIPIFNTNILTPTGGQTRHHQHHQRKQREAPQGGSERALPQDDGKGNDHLSKATTTTTKMDKGNHQKKARATTTHGDKGNRQPPKEETCAYISVVPVFSLCIFLSLMFEVLQTLMAQLCVASRCLGSPQLCSDFPES